MRETLLEQYLEIVNASGTHGQVVDFFIAKMQAREMEVLEMIGKESREKLSELEHEQWISWSKNIAETENITSDRLERWQILWRPYSELTEAEKDQDREWADKSLAIIQSERESVNNT